MTEYETHQKIEKLEADVGALTERLSQVEAFLQAADSRVANQAASDETFVTEQGEND